MTSASKGYTWLNGKGYISSSNAPLADPSQSCLSWLGGNMPPGGPSSDMTASSKLKSWAAAGAPNN
jgi:hypothetical protein